MTDKPQGNGDHERGYPKDNAAAQAPGDTAASPQATVMAKPVAGGVPVIGIGASAGGIEALGRFFGAMPVDSGCAFVVVLHLDPDRESELAQVLQLSTAMKVVQVKDGMVIVANQVHVIAPDTDLKVAGGVLHVARPAAPHGQRHPVDVLFASLAQDQRARAVAIVLSGTGRNGTEGLRTIRAEGGMSLVQSPATAKFDGMPRSAIAADMADHVLAPEAMPQALLAFMQHGYGTAPERFGFAAPDSHVTLDDVLSVLNAQGGHDFRCYKQSTLKRRIHRRLGLRNVATLDDYIDVLRATPEEVTTLTADLMISVTGFFRDPEAWKTLGETVIAPLVAERATGAAIRIWAPACSTGEEAYSLAMLVTELAEAAGKRFDIKVFATDAQESNLRCAREGLYPAAALADLPPERLARFFQPMDGSFRVTKELRETVVFAPQNLLRDPPFSRLDIVSCRNLLIYLEPEAQQKVIALCHFALCEGGHLFLGNAETIGRHEDLFETVSKKWRIFRRLGATRHDLLDYAPPRDRTEPRLAENPQPLAVEPGAWAAELARRTLLDAYAPASVLIDPKGRILHFHGKTRDYIENPAGAPTTDLLTMARDGLSARLRAAIRKASKENAPVAVDARIRENGTTRAVRLTVIPLPAPPKGGSLLVSFAPAPPPSDPGRAMTPEDVTASENALREELRAARAELQHTIEYQETTNEELKAANEEATSINEELQSTNEELETSKEELQSFNEELNTVNSQLQHKIGELQNVTDDLNNLLAGSETATLFLDQDFCIRWFAPAMQDLFDFMGADIGRPIAHLAPKFHDPALMQDAGTVLAKLAPIEAEVRSDTGRWYSRRVLPYRTQDNHIAGVVVTFSDITDRKRAADEINAARLYAETIVRTVQHPLLVLDKTFRVKSANKAFHELFAVFDDDPKGRVVFELGTGDWNNPPLRHLLDKVLSEDEEIHNFEFEQEFVLTGKRLMSLTACRLPQEGGADDLILIAVDDITERKRFDEHRDLLVGELNHRIKNVMATVNAIASQTLRGAGSLKEAAATFETRLVALGKSHDLLTRENWAGADLRDIVADTVEPLAGGTDRIRVAGPRLWLQPSVALSFAMAVHELATNAAKYGALANADGHVDVVWHLSDDGEARRLVLKWSEIGGPAVVPPTHKGFGSRLVQQVLAAELGGTVDIAYPPTGVVCTIEAPMPDPAGDAA